MPEAELATPNTAPPRGRWKRLKRILKGALALALLLAAPEAARVFFGSNFHAVLPGRVYRCAQPTARGLEELVAAHGIRTVVNLRGCCDPFPWYLDECRATERLDICQEDVCLSAGRLPSVPELRRLADVLERGEAPLLLHCRRGADRTGLASAIGLLLLTDTGLTEAGRQLGIRYGHVRLGRPAHLDQFLDLYVAWLRARGREHSRAVFRHWLLHDYRAGPCHAAIELLSPRPLTVRPGRPAAVRVRARNLGVEPWHFRPTVNAGVHVGFHLWDEQDRQVGMDKAGLFDAVVRPGESIELTLPLPGLARPGRYRLMVDLVDEQQCWFFQTGSEPLEEELEVRE